MSSKRPDVSWLSSGVHCVVAGLLLSYGVIVLLFDYAHSGSNTRPWQLIVGLAVPAALVAATCIALRARNELAGNVLRVVLTTSIACVLGAVLLLTVFG